MEKRILLVEDQGITAKTQSLQLEKEGYSVNHVFTGEQAIAYLEHDISDLILMDIELGSGIDGIQTADIILENHNIPIIFLSSHTEKHIISRTETINHYGYVVKSSGIGVLDASIKMALKLFRSQNYKKTENKDNAVYEIDKLHSQIIDGVEQGIAVYGLDLRYKVWNRFMENLTGIPANQVLGRHPEEVFPFLTENGITSNIKKALAGKRSDPVQFNFTPSHIDTPKAVINICLPLRNTSSKVIGAIGIIQDITERNQIQESFQSSEDRFKGAFETAAHGMAITDIHGTFLQINQAFCDIVGYQKEEILKIDFRQITYPEDLTPDIINLNRLLADEIKSYRLEKRYYHKKGHVIWVLLSVSLIRDKDNLPLNFITQVIDITDRKLSEEKIKREQKFSSGLISAMRDGFSLVDNKGVQIDVNSSFCEMTGFSRDELIGCSIPFPYWPPEEYENINKAFQRSLQLDFENFELIFLKKNGERFPVIVSPAPLYDIDGNIINFLATVKDITERKIVEQEKQKLLQEKELLLKEVHHRTKNNINVMMSLLSIQANKLTDSPAIEVLKDANKRMKSMMVLYDKLYNTANYRSLSIKDFLTSLIDEIANIFSKSEIITVNKNIDNFILDVEILLPIGIIINELITNSVKYAFVEQVNNKIDISVALKDDYVTIVFQDNGKGLDESINLDNSKGLGLMLVSELCKQINAKISIQRKNGTKFIFEFAHNLSK